MQLSMINEFIREFREAFESSGTILPKESIVKRLELVEQIPGK